VGCVHYFRSVPYGKTAQVSQAERYRSRRVRATGALHARERAAAVVLALPARTWKAPEGSRQLRNLAIRTAK